MSKHRSELIKSYYKKVKTANKELTKKEAFKDLLNRLYSGENEIEKIIDAISAGAERTIINIPRKDKLHKGSADTLYNKIIIEFENDLRVNLKHAKEQFYAVVGVRPKTIFSHKTPHQQPNHRSSL